MTFRTVQAIASAIALILYVAAAYAGPARDLACASPQ